MAVWKILIIGILSFICLGLMMATIAIPVSQDGAQRWIWLACLLAATFLTGSLLAFFLRYAGTSLDVSPRGRHR